MKNSYLIFVLTIGMAFGVYFLTDNKEQNTRKYIPREELTQKKKINPTNAGDWLARRRNNQITGTIQPSDVEKARLQFAQTVNKQKIYRRI